MEELNINKICCREENAANIKKILQDFELNKNDLLFKKGIYIYGEPGTGKTTFVTKILKEMNFDIIKYDAGDIRNTSVIEDITKHNMSDKNIMSLFHKQVKKIAIVMDEIDGMNNGDKGGINTLIKLIRPKKTKKQKLEETTVNPIICIGNYKVDKKIKELMKVCNIIESVLQIKSYSDDTKKITNKLINNYYPISEHNNIMNETDRTSVGLLWHENIIDVIDKIDKKQSVPFYLKQLDNICFADYIDRITFQKQIWQFNEMSSLVKTFKNNKLYHETIKNKQKYNPTEVRFTKVLTKYSTEYNNSLFIQKLCQRLGMDKKDLFGFFIGLKNEYDDNTILNLLENYEVSKLDINRIYRYIEKYIKENATGTADKELEEEDDDCDCENFDE